MPKEIDDPDNSNTYDLDNIEKLSIEITEPYRHRDASYHQPTTGIFQNPDSTLSFKANIQLDSIESGNPLNPDKIIVESPSQKKNIELGLKVLDKERTLSSQEI